MEKRWRIRPHDAARIALLERSANVPPLVAQLLLSRGICDPVAAAGFLEAKLSGLRDPEQLPGLNGAADRIHSAIQQKRRIVIYGDYDADGMTATGLLYRCLRLLGANVGYYLPKRLEEGYGLNEQALRQLASEGASTVITVDCGISGVHEALVAAELGLELIITDHHPAGSELPAAAAVVHPRLPGSTYPFGELCGAGVAFKLAWALCQRASEAKRVSPALRDFLLSAVGLAALGTVADVVPLLDENRILVRHGLLTLREQPVPGIAALLRVTKLDQKAQLCGEDLAFTIAPRLNAAGRLNQAILGVELLTTDSADRATSLAEYIHELNGTRETLERSVYLAAHDQAKHQLEREPESPLVLADTGWHPGVIGIVAGRLAEKYHRPVVVISWDTLGGKPGIGSARSIGRFDLNQALCACCEHLVSHGGHAAAAGLKIEHSKLESFRSSFCEYVCGELCREDREPELNIDAEATLAQLTHSAVQQIEQLAPFGQGNPRPVLCASGVTLAEPPRKIGGGERHLSVRMRQHGVTLRGVAFGQGEAADELARSQALDIAFRPVINEFNGARKVEMHLVAWRPASTSGMAASLSTAGVRS